MMYLFIRSFAREGKGEGEGETVCGFLSFPFISFNLS